MQFPVLLIVLIFALVFRANSREYIDGPDNQAASPIHPKHFPGGLLNPDFSGEENYTSNGLDGLESLEENPLTFGVDQQLKKDVTEQNRNELRGNSGKGSIKKLMKSLEAMERKLTQANQELKTELQAIKEQQANISNMNTEVKTDLQSIGAVITNHTAILESIKDCNSNLVTPPTTTTTTTVAPTTATTTTTVAPTTTTTEIPAGFERFDGRVIRRTLSSDPKTNYDGCISFCDRYSAKPFIPRSSDDYQLYKDVRGALGISGYMYLPADDRRQEGVMRWFNGALTSSMPLWDWHNNQELIYNTAIRDCLWYGASSRPVVYMGECDGGGWKSYPPICEKM